MAYKDISRGVRLAADHAKYMAWLEKDTAARQAAFGTVFKPANKVKTDRVPGAIVPFNATGSSLVFLPARLINPTQTGRGDVLAKALQAILNPFTFTTSELVTLNQQQIKPNIVEGTKNFKFAKLSIIQRVTTATTKEASRITGRLYYRHENDSVTGHFGKKVAADTYASVILAIEGSPEFKALVPGSGAVANRYRFTPEGIK